MIILRVPRMKLSHSSGKGNDHKVAFAARCVGDSSMPIHNTEYDAFDRKYHATIGCFLNDDILDQLRADPGRAHRDSVGRGPCPTRGRRTTSEPLLRCSGASPGEATLWWRERSRKRRVPAGESSSKAPEEQRDTSHERLEVIMTSSADIGWGYHDRLCDDYYSAFPKDE